MKKFLALLLTILMIASMIPATLAGDAEEPVSVTFSFIKGGRSDAASETVLEHFVWTPADTVDKNTQYSIVRNEKLAGFPTASDNPNDQWAYVGSGIGRSLTYAAPTAGNATIASLGDDKDGKGYISTYTLGNGSWIAFKIKVPKTALYKITGVTAFAYKNAASSAGMYVVPASNELDAAVATAINSGSFSATEGTSGSYVGKYLIYRNSFPIFSTLGIDSDCLMGKVNLNDTTGNYYSSDREIANTKAQTLEAGKEYYLFLEADLGGALTFRTITLTETTAEDAAVTNPVFNFGAPAFKDISDIKDSGGHQRLINATSYDYINTTVSTGRWAYVKDFYMSNNLVESDDSLFCTGNLSLNSIVLKLEVGKSGIYRPTLDYEKYDYCGKINMWTIPVEESANSYTSYLQVYDLIDKAQYIGSVDAHSDSSAVSPFVGNDVYMPAGDNYLIMTITKGAGETTNKNGYYYAYIKSLALERKAGAILSAEKTEINKGKAITLSTYVADADNKPLAAELTYESSNPNVATVNSSTGVVTGVGAGTATITVTAVTETGTYTDSIDITVDTKWDMKYVFTNSVVASHTASSATPNLNQVTALKEDATDSWEYVNQLGVDAGGLYGDGIQYRCKPAYYLDEGENANAIIVKLNFSETGTYLPTLAGMRRTFCGKNDIYLVSKSYADSKWKMTSDALSVPDVVADPGVEKVVSANLYHTVSTESNPTLFSGAAYNVDEKEVYAIIVLGNNDENVIDDASRRLWGYPQYLEMTRTGSVKLLADKTTLSKGDTTTLVSTVKDNRDNAYEAEVTYETLNASVATVSGSTVTAVAPGTATIKASATVDGVVVSDTVEITVGEETVKKTVSIATSINGEEDVKSYTRGSKVTVTAPEIDGKVFRHWVRGTAANGDWVSADAEYSFTATTHTYLTAVYTNEVTGKLVEFFNGNGEYLSEAIADENGKVALPENPSITGYVFDKWLLDANTEFTADTVLTKDITRVVAGFKDADKTYSVNGVKYKYGEEATFESAIDMVWYRNDEAVAYGKSYTYYVWDEAAISWEKGEAAPMVVLDKEVKDGNAYMIEYDACGKNIVEVGIIFGNGNHTVDSCDSKATSQRGLSRGQFTAKPANDGSSVARGYLVYEENGAYKVVYSK